MFSCQYFEKLSHLDLSSNKLYFFDGNCMRSENYIDLFVKDNQLTNITLHSNYSKLYASSNELKWIIIESKISQLSSFFVSNNRIENIPNIIEYFGESMIDLNLSDNLVGKLNVSTFTKLKNLKVLSLRNTSLANIPYEAFHHQRKLSTLDISFNSLKKINFDGLWRDLPMLRNLSVDGNNLTEVNGLSKADFPNLTSLGITDNNFTCKYLGEYLRQWNRSILLPDDGLLLNRSHVENIFCNEETDNHYYYIPGFSA